MLLSLRLLLYKALKEVNEIKWNEEILGGEVHAWLLLISLINRHGVKKKVG